MKTSFVTKLIQEEGKNATGINVPAEAVAELNSGKKPKVTVSFKGYSYRTTVAAYGDVFMLPVSAEHREAAGVKAGDELEVTLELDTAPRIIEVPDYLAAALEAHHLREKFDALATSVRKEYVRQVDSAKAEETRQRRLDKIISQLSEK